MSFVGNTKFEESRSLIVGGSADAPDSVAELVRLAQQETEKAKDAMRQPFIETCNAVILEMPEGVRRDCLQEAQKRKLVAFCEDVAMDTASTVAGSTLAASSSQGLTASTDQASTFWYEEEDQEDPLPTAVVEDMENLDDAILAGLQRSKDAGLDPVSEESAVGKKERFLIENEVQATLRNLLWDLHTSDNFSSASTGDSMISITRIDPEQFNARLSSTFEKSQMGSLTPSSWWSVL